jgi:hypothetical protein
VPVVVFVLCKSFYSFQLTCCVFCILGPMYVWYNNLLRYLSAAYDPKLSPFDDYKQKGLQTVPFPFKTTLHVLNSAIIKLSRAQPAVRVYRGTKVLHTRASLLTIQIV